jgi:WD40 repeat protein
MTDVFISYAREDRRFVQRLHDSLATEGRESWVDWEGIPASAKWMAEVRAAIDQADCFCFVVSPDSVESPVCREEAAHAASGNKRIIPLLHREVADGLVPETVAAHNWISFRDQDPFDPAFATLVQALETEPEHLHAHTRLLVRAKEWEGTKDRSLLLRGQDLNQAESWLAASQGKEPAPTPQHTAYVLASRKAASRRQRTRVGAVAVALVISLVLSTVAVIQRSSAVDAQARAEEQRALAERRAAESRSRELAAASVSQLEADPELSLLLANEALNSARTPEAIDALRQSLTESSVRMTLRADEGTIGAVAFSPDGEHVVTASYEGTARIWSSTSTEEPVLLTGHTDLIQTAAFSPDGTRVVTASFDATARVWDAATGAEVATLRGHVGAVRSAAFSPDGSLVVTAGDDATARVWDAETGAQLHLLEGHDRPVYDAAFSPDGRLVVTASDDDTARIWGARTGRPLQVLRGHQDGVYAASFDPSGTLVATASEDETAKVWDVESGRVVADLTRHRGPVVVAVFSPDGERVLTASEDGTAQLWDVSSGRQVASFRGHGDEITDASMSPDGRLVVTASADGKARVWSAADGTTIGVLRGHVGEVMSAAFAPNGERVVTGGSDGTARIWEPLSGQVLSRGDVSGFIEETGGDRVAVSTNDGFVHVFGAPSGHELLTLETDVPLTGVSFSGDGQLIAAGDVDGVGRVWDSHSGELVAELRGHEPMWMAVGFYGQDDRVLTWSDDGTARLWDARSGEELSVFDHGASRGRSIWEAHLSPDGTRVFTTGTTDGRVEMWDATTGEQLWSQTGLLATGGIGAGFSPDGRFIGTVSAGASIWETETGRKVSTLDYPSKTFQVAFSPSGDTVVTRAEDAALTWDPLTGVVLAVMPGHGGVVTGALPSSDGRWIVTTADDGLTRVWNARTGELVATFEGAGGPGNFAVWVADDRAIVSWSQAGVRVDRCDVCDTLDNLLELARTRVTRTFTDVERAEFLGEQADDQGVSSAPQAGLTNRAGEPVPDAPLAAGEYSAVGFEPQLSFTLGDGWQLTTFLNRREEGEVTLARVVQLQQLDTPSNGLAFTFLDPGRAIDGRKDWDERNNIQPFPNDLATWFAAHPNLETQPPEAVAVGGVEGTSVQTLVTSSPDAENPWPVCGVCVEVLAFTLDHETGPITTDDLVNVLGPGEIDRWIVVRTDSGTVLINYWAASRRDFERFVPIAEEVLATVRIGG